MGFSGEIFAHGEHHEHGNVYGPYASTSPDSGTCGNDWAQDTFNRVFHVKDNHDGTFYIREQYRKGKFETLAGASPGACQTTKHHGTMVDAGIKGGFNGYIAGTVTGGTFDKQAARDFTCPDPATCTGDAFVAAAFGPSATWTVEKFAFQYHSHNHALTFHHWTNADHDASTPENNNHGDIATQ
jgi:hypothetical protein